MVQGMIFDLDNCIFNTRSMKESFLSSVVGEMRIVDTDKILTDEMLRRIKTGLWYLSLEDVVSMYKIPHNIVEAMRKSFATLEAPDCSKAYSDVDLLRYISPAKVLVTCGYLKLQQSKIEKLGIEDVFDEVLIDPIDDPKKQRGKLSIFKEILKRKSWSSDKIMVIGDNANSELKVGKEIGAITVQTLRTGVVKVDGFDYYIKTFAEVERILSKFRFE